MYTHDTHACVRMLKSNAHIKENEDASRQKDTHTDTQNTHKDMHTEHTENTPARASARHPLAHAFPSPLQPLCFHTRTAVAPRGAHAMADNKKKKQQSAKVRLRDCCHRSADACVSKMEE